MNETNPGFKFNMRTTILCGVILLNLLPAILISGFVFWHMKFPTITDPEYSMVAIGGYLLPSVICYVLLRIKSVTKNRWITLANTIVVVLAITISAGCVLLSILLFPIKSSTKNHRNYMVLDKFALPYAENISKIFPEKIPSSAENINYSYDFRTGLPGERVEIEALWELPEEEYLNIMKSVEGDPLFENTQDTIWELKLPDGPYVCGLDLFIEFDHNSLSVIYSAIIDN